MNLLKRLLRTAPTPAPAVVHPTLGALRYVSATRDWETVSSQPIYHGGISGSSTEPDADKVAEVLQRMSNVDQYWRACESDLRYIAGQYPPFPKDVDLKALFRVAALSLYRSYWEICFETIRPHKWLYVGMQFEGERLVSNTIDT